MDKTLASFQDVGEEAIVSARATKTIIEDCAVVVTKEALETLDMQLGIIAKSNIHLKQQSEADDNSCVTYDVDFQDGGSRTFGSLATLLAQENHGKRKISKIAIISSLEYRGLSVSLAIGTGYPNIRGVVAGGDAEVLIARGHCADFVAAIYSPFAWMYSRRGNFLIISIWIMLVLGGNYFVFYTGRTPFAFGSAVIVGLALFVCAFAMMFGIDNFRAHFFPKAIFAIGNEAARFKRLESTYTWAIRALAVTVISAFCGGVWKIVQTM